MPDSQTTMRNAGLVAGGVLGGGGGAVVGALSALFAQKPTLKTALKRALIGGAIGTGAGAGALGYLGHNADVASADYKVTRNKQWQDQTKSRNKRQSQRRIDGINRDIDRQDPELSPLGNALASLLPIAGPALYAKHKGASPLNAIPMSLLTGIGAAPLMAVPKVGLPAYGALQMLGGGVMASMGNKTKRQNLDILTGRLREATEEHSNNFG